MRAARQQGFRSRSALKLVELDNKLQLFFDGTVIAVDILPISAIECVEFVCGDFTVVQTAAAVVESLK